MTNIRSFTKRSVAELRALTAGFILGCSVGGKSLETIAGLLTLWLSAEIYMNQKLMQLETRNAEVQKARPKVKIQHTEAYGRGFRFEYLNAGGLVFHAYIVFAHKGNIYTLDESMSGNSNFVMSVTLSEPAPFFGYKDTEYTGLLFGAVCDINLHYYDVLEEYSNVIPDYRSWLEQKQKLFLEHL